MNRWTRATRERNQAAELLRQGFPQLTLRPGDDHRFRLEHVGVADSRWSIQRLSIHGSGSARGTITDSIAVGRVRAGRVALSYGRAAVDTSLPYLRPPGESELSFSRVVLELIAFDPVAYRRDAARYLRGSGRQLTVPDRRRTAPLSPALGRLWAEVSTHIQVLAVDPELFDNDLVRGQLYDHALQTFLSAFPVTTDAPLAVNERALVGTAVIQRAVDHIHAHAEGSLTVADLAEVAGISVRGLHAAFLRELGTSPMVYLRDVRLDAVHDALTDADPETTTVAGTARLHGFVHLSRFADHYRRRHGQSPRDTLRS